VLELRVRDRCGWATEPWGRSTSGLWARADRSGHREVGWRYGVQGSSHVVSRWASVHARRKQRSTLQACGRKSGGCGRGGWFEKEVGGRHGRVGNADDAGYFVGNVLRARPRRTPLYDFLDVSELFTLPGRVAVVVNTLRVWVCCIGGR